MSNMKRMSQYFYNRFPSGRDTWKFAKAHRQAGFFSSELSLATTPPHTHVEIPAEIVEHIYRLGWKDAIQAAKYAIAEEAE